MRLDSGVELVVVGHATRDLIIHDAHTRKTPEIRLGAAVSFAAQAAACFCVRTAVVTAAPAGFRLLAPLEQEPLIEIVTTESAVPTTFELDYSGPVRGVRLLERAHDIQPAHIPARFKNAPLAYVAPVAGECGRAVVEALSAGRVVVGAQGWLRDIASDGRIVPRIHEEAEHPPDGLFAVVFSELDHPDAKQLAQRFARNTPVVGLTRGARGVSLYVDGTCHNIAPDPANEVDPTGAGDVFGLVLGIATSRNVPPLQAARLAAQAAARVVEGPGLGRLPEFCASRVWHDAVAA